MKKKIAILSGDGIGIEIMKESIKILNHIAKIYHHTFEYQQALIGGAAYDTHGVHFPEETKKICRKSDAILFGAVGGPVANQMAAKWQNCEKNALLEIRKYFQFHINVRPVKTYKSLTDFCVLKKEIIEKGVDILCIRELKSDIYFGEHKTEKKNGILVASDVMTYDEKTIENVARVAFKFALKRRKKVTSVDKANVLDCSKLWRKVVEKVALLYPDCILEHMLVDNCSMQVLKRPHEFDVLLMPNMFGDIISDEISIFSGSLGMLPSASFNNKGFGLYEPSSGSAQDIAGKGIANPIGMILSCAMMLKYSFGLSKEHDAIQDAVLYALEAGHRTRDLGGTLKTEAMGDAIVKYFLVVDVRPDKMQRRFWRTFRSRNSPYF